MLRFLSEKLEELLHASLIPASTAELIHRYALTTTLMLLMAIDAQHVFEVSVRSGKS